MDGASYTVSHFLRRSGDVLSAAATDDVVLRRRDGEDLVLTTTSRGQALRDAVDLLAETVLEVLRAPGGADLLARALSDAARWTASLSAEERMRMLADVGRAGAAAAALGRPERLARVLGGWRQTARDRDVPGRASAHHSRPVAIPDDVDDPDVPKASGRIELPLRVRWSHPLRTYDLDDPRQLRRVYEQVLREGTEEDVRRFVDVDSLVANWDELVLPPRVRRAWADWLRARRGVDVPC